MKPLVKLAMAMLIGTLTTGCQVVQAGIFIATVPHYHGGEVRDPQSEPVTERVPFRVPPTVLPDAEDE